MTAPLRGRRATGRDGAVQVDTIAWPDGTYTVEGVNPWPPAYSPQTCCACRWVVWGEDCGHGASDGIESPHDHCRMHGGTL